MAARRWGVDSLGAAVAMPSRYQRNAASPPRGAAGRVPAQTKCLRGGRHAAVPSDPSDVDQAEQGRRERGVHDARERPRTPPRAASTRRLGAVALLELLTAPAPAGIVAPDLVLVVDDALLDHRQRFDAPRRPRRRPCAPRHAAPRPRRPRARPRRRRCGRPSRRRGPRASSCRRRANDGRAATAAVLALRR